MLNTLSIAMFSFTDNPYIYLSTISISTIVTFMILAKVKPIEPFPSLPEIESGVEESMQLKALEKEIRQASNILDHYISHEERANLEANIEEIEKIEETKEEKKRSDVIDFG